MIVHSATIEDLFDEDIYLESAQKIVEQELESGRPGAFVTTRDIGLGKEILEVWGWSK